MGRYDNDQKHAVRCPQCGRYYDPFVEDECVECVAKQTEAKQDMRNGYDEPD